LGKQDGKIVTRPTPLSRRRTGDLAGGYFVYLYRSDNNDYYGEFEAELTPNGRFTFRRLTLTGATGLPLEIAGRFAVGKDDAVYITTSMRGIAGASLDFDPSEVNKITAAEGAAIATGAGGLGIVSAFWTCVFGSCGADGFKTFEIAPASVVGGTNAVGVIELYRDAAQDLEIFLTSTNPLLVRVPASTTIVDGSDRGGFPVETSPVEQRTQVFVTGSYADFVEDAVITLEPQP
jgi:hypothetical protein